MKKAMNLRKSAKRMLNSVRNMSFGTADNEHDRALDDFEEEFMAGAEAEEAFACAAGEARPILVDDEEDMVRIPVMTPKSPSSELESHRPARAKVSGASFNDDSRSDMSFGGSKRSSKFRDQYISTIKRVNSNTSTTPSGPILSAEPRAFPLRAKGRNIIKHRTSEVIKKNKNINVMGKRMPVILITDIGADIDDTLALFVLLGATNLLNLVALVTSVNDGVARGALAQGWLRNLGVKDHEVEILPSRDSCTAACHVPEGFPPLSECNLGRVEDTPQRIIDLCKRHRHTGVVIVGIAALTPLANALAIDKEGAISDAVRRVYLQGNVFVETDENTGRSVLTPNPLAYNFRNDLRSAETVFSELQHRVPFTILGKFAAYRIGITKGDFDYLSDQSGYVKSLSQQYHRPSLTYMAQCQMNNFRKGNPELFNKIYQVPVMYQDDLESMAWFEELPPSGVCSHPYDPLLMLSLVEDTRLAKDRDVGSRSDPVLSKALSGEAKSTTRDSYWFEKKYIFVENKISDKKKKKSGQIMHTIIGNSEEEHGVPDPELLHGVLVEHIARGLRRQGNSRLSKY